MNYFTAWLSLIGWGEAGFILVVLLLLGLADRLILWEARHPWKGLLK